MTTYERFLNSLTSTLRNDPNLFEYVRGYAYLGNKYSDATLRTTPLVQLFTQNKSYFHDVARAEGVGIKLWDAISEGSFFKNLDPVKATANLIGLNVPGLDSTQNAGLRKAITNFYFDTLSESEKDELLTAHARWIVAHPAEEGSILAHLPAATWSVVRDAAKAIADAVGRGGEVLKNIIPWKTILLVGGGVLAIYILLPRLGQSAGGFLKARR